MNLKYIFLPWLYANDLERELAKVDQEIADLEHDVRGLLQVHEETSELCEVASRDFAVLLVTVGDIVDSIENVQKPNGTSVKVLRRALAGIEECKAHISPEAIDQARFMLEQEREASEPVELEETVASEND